ncbi:MAG TPA: GNAT family N-acetyltransferase [Actinocrinis sp.]|uniref:GNAT family N-acetyltransferase n=1 Tax=Actinocrinis sp. TaxID=1920516 RepID=UPI002DDD0DC3|nr:GNAT family N-acetyltransferase [Actinocrinis sp.]HEV2342682.1 GNAT family N-acetyltransferase [Actinocrinis sp.]
MAELEIRTVTDSSTEAIGALYAEVGFRPGLVIDAFFVRDVLGGAVFAGLVGGRTVAAAVALPFPGTGWLGGIAVSPDYQRRGFGEVVTTHAMRWLAARGAVTLQLNATKAGLPLYQRLGFRVEGESAQFSGMVPVTVATDAAGQVRAAVTADLPVAIELDRAATGEDRSSLLESAWPNAAYARVYESRADRRVIGYQLARDPGSLGAIITDGSAEAEGFLAALLSGAAGVADGAEVEGGDEASAPGASGASRASDETGASGASGVIGVSGASGVIRATKVTGAAEATGAGTRTICLPLDNTAAVDQLRAAGFQESLRTTRMYAGPRVSWVPGRLVGMFNLFWS